MDIFKVLAIIKQVKGLLKAPQTIAQIAASTPGQKILLIKDALPKQQAGGKTGRLNLYWETDQPHESI